MSAMLGGMLSLYRRHLAKCPHRDQGAAQMRCKCPIWVIGVLAGRSIRQSLKTRNLQRAANLVAKMEVTQTVDVEHPAAPTIADACKAAIADAEARKLSSETIRKIRTLCKQVEEFAKGRGDRFVNEVDFDWTASFRASWKDEANSGSKKLERLRSVMKIWLNHGWISHNFARDLRPPKKVELAPTLPFEQHEVVAMLEHLPKLGGMSDMRQRQLRALILLLRYSGLRISDAVKLHRDRVTAKGILLYMEKTKVPVLVPVPDFVVARLEDIARPDGYFFAGCSTRPEVAAGNFRRSLRRLGALANVPNLHPHRFRDTFAVQLLLAGVSIEIVSKLLGHSSVRITEKHYSPWVTGRQAQLEAAVKRALAFEVQPAETQAAATRAPLETQKAAG